MPEFKTVTLPSGKVATVRTPAIGRDLIMAQRVLKKNAGSAETAFAMLAQLVQIDGKPIVFEDVADLQMADLEALTIAAGLAKDPTFPPPPSSPDSSGSASQ